MSTKNLGERLSKASSVAAQVAEILNCGADPSAPCGAEKDWQADWTPLTIAARENQPESIRLLIAAGGDAKAKNRLDLTALSIAASNGHAECVEALLPASDAFGPDGGGSEAIRRAIQCQKWSCADAFAVEAPIQSLVHAVNCAPKNAMPKAQAMLDRAQLADIVEEAKKTPNAAVESDVPEFPERSANPRRL